MLIISGVTVFAANEFRGHQESFKFFRESGAIVYLAPGGEGAIV
jgi:hypothetical protein